MPFYLTPKQDDYNKAGLQGIEITQETLSISGREKSQAIRWQDVSGATHKLRAGEKWVFE